MAKWNIFVSTWTSTTCGSSHSPYSLLHSNAMSVCVFFFVSASVSAVSNMFRFDDARKWKLVLCTSPEMHWIHNYNCTSSDEYGRRDGTLDEKKHTQRHKHTEVDRRARHARLLCLLLPKIIQGDTIHDTQYSAVRDAMACAPQTTNGDDRRERANAWWAGVSVCCWRRLI